MLNCRTSVANSGSVDASKWADVARPFAFTVPFARPPVLSMRSTAEIVTVGGRPSSSAPMSTGPCAASRGVPSKSAADTSRSEPRSIVPTEFAAWWKSPWGAGLTNSGSVV